MTEVALTLAGFVVFYIVVGVASLSMLLMHGPLG